MTSEEIISGQTWSNNDSIRNIDKQIAKIVQAIDRQSEGLQAACVILVAKGICTADELKQALEQVKQL